MFCVALYEVHMSNFGGPPLYLDIQQHHEALLGDVAATTLAAFCLDLWGALGCFFWHYMKNHIVSNFGSPSLYFDMQQHRDVILESVAASSVRSPCGLSV